MQKYETTIVLDSLLKSEDMTTTVNKVETFIKNNGGNIIEIEDWGKKRLAYEINRKQYGNYYHIHFEGPGTLPELLEREYRLEESLLRYLTVVTDSHILRAQAKKADSEKRAAAEAVETAAPTEPEPVAEADQAETAEKVDAEEVASEGDAETDAPEEDAEEGKEKAAAE